MVANRIRRIKRTRMLAKGNRNLPGKGVLHDPDRSFFPCPDFKGDHSLIQKHASTGEPFRSTRLRRPEERGLGRVIDQIADKVFFQDELSADRQGVGPFQAERRGVNKTIGIDSMLDKSFVIMDGLRVGTGLLPDIVREKVSFVDIKITKNYFAGAGEREAKTHGAGSPT